MATLVEVKVPDIGDFKDIPVIEVFVKSGDAIKAEEPLITLESDKATMDVPSPVDGVVKEVKVKVGDKVSEGTLILTVDAAAAPAGVAPAEKVKGAGRSTAAGAPRPTTARPACTRRSTCAYPTSATSRTCPSSRCSSRRVMQ